VWGAAPRITPIGLSRYHDEAEGPCPEVDPGFYQRNPQTPAYWRHDRALRESGWDLTHRFGEDAHMHVPVCLNALLYRYERDLAAMYRRLDGARSARATRYERRALLRRRLVDEFLWNEKSGLYFDWSLSKRAQSTYESAATFYPLWVGMASGEQAARVAENAERFLAPGGLLTTTQRSRDLAPEERFQWDWPLGWAPLNIIAVEGLRRYGYHHLADRIAYRWVWMVMQIAGEGNGIIKEKYDVVSRTVEVNVDEYHNQGNDRGAYLSTESQKSLGFGWTNASIPLLVAGLEEPLQAKLDADVRPGLAGL
jgi:alpha,alpha-trehalase